MSFQGFRGGSFLAPFDLTPDKCNGLHNHRGSEGSIEVRVDFSNPLKEAIYIIYELIYPKALINDKVEREVYVVDVA